MIQNNEKKVDGQKYILVICVSQDMACIIWINEGNKLSKKVNLENREKSRLELDCPFFARFVF